MHFAYVINATSQHIVMIYMRYCLLASTNFFELVKFTFYMRRKEIGMLKTERLRFSF